MGNDPRGQWYTVFALAAIENEDWEGLDSFDRAAHEDEENTDGQISFPLVA